jgi:hypothetical protein
MNPAYKHLEQRLRIGEFTLWQWAGVLTGITLAMVWGFYVSPFGVVLTLFSAIYFAGLPALAALMASVTEFDLLGLLRSSWRWWRSEGRYLPGAGPEAPEGYVVYDERRGRELASGVEPPDLEALWGS